MGEFEKSPVETSVHDWQNTLLARYETRHPDVKARVSHILKELNGNADESHMLDPDMVNQLDIEVKQYVDIEDDLALDRIMSLIKLV